MFLALLDPHPDPLVRGTDPRIRIRGSVHLTNGSGSGYVS